MNSYKEVIDHREHLESILKTREERSKMICGLYDKWSERDFKIFLTLLQTNPLEDVEGIEGAIRYFDKLLKTPLERKDSVDI